MAFTLARSSAMTLALTGLLNINEQCVKCDTPTVSKFGWQILQLILLNEVFDCRPGEGGHKKINAALNDMKQFSFEFLKSDKIFYFS